MSTDLYEGYGNSPRHDPTTRTKTADASGVLILNLGDRAQTLIVDDATETIKLLNKLVEINKPVFKDLTPEEAAAAGYGVHVAATTDTNRGHTASKIDVQNDDGTAAEELKTLFLIAADGGAVGGAEDINLRLGASQTGPNAFVEILVDGKWSTDILRVEGALAAELLSLLTSPAPALFTDGNDEVDFATLLVGDYADGTQYDAGGGNDRVTLPEDLAAALAAGYDPAVAFNAGDGNDTINAGGLNDTVFGGEGNDFIFDTGGTSNYFDGGAGNDRIYLFKTSDDTALGGTGTNQLWFWRDGPGLTLDIGAGTATGQGTDVFSDFIFFNMSDSDDVIYGSAVNTQTRLYDGNDLFIGGAGFETIKVADGTNTIDGGDGVDRIDYDVASVGVTVDLGQGWAPARVPTR